VKTKDSILSTVLKWIAKKEKNCRNRRFIDGSVIEQGVSLEIANYLISGHVISAEAEQEADDGKGNITITYKANYRLA
jgi:hypothetical protein